MTKKVGRTHDNEAIPKLLRAIAGGSNAREAGQDRVLRQAADELETAWDHLVDIEQADFVLDLPMKAHAIKVAHCSNPECMLAHIALVDEEDRPLATAVLDEHAVRQLDNWLKRLKA